MVCDVKISSKELIRCKSYDLTGIPSAFSLVKPHNESTTTQGLQILLMSGVTMTSASQIFESFWNIWSQVSHRKKPNRLSSTWSWHVYTIVRDTRSSCGGPLPGKLKSMMAFDRNLPSSCFVVQYNSLI